jgi:hypothetical protein
MRLDLPRSALVAAALTLPASLALTVGLAAQADPPRIIDMHLHALPADFNGPPPSMMCVHTRTFPALDPRDSWGEVFTRGLAESGCERVLRSPETTEEVMERTLEVLERRNIVAVASGPLELVGRYEDGAPERIIRGLIFDLGSFSLPPDSLRRLHAAGQLEVVGEVVTQYSGVAPDDPRMEPYWALAEELDIPVGIHLGTGPPGAPYLGTPDYRAELNSALTLEPVLAQHPKLRVYVMHAGWPMIDDLLSLLYTYPQVYVDTGVIDYLLPRAEFHAYMRRIVEAGFGNRVMFGSDQMIWPETIEVAIESIESAEFLTPAQKRAILHDNAARFLRIE